MSFWFHNRVELTSNRLGAQGKQIELATEPSGATVVLGVLSLAADLTIATSRELLLQGRGYATRDEALEAGRRWRYYITDVFARLQIAIDIGPDDDVRPVQFVQEVEPPEILAPMGVRVGDRVVVDVNEPRLLAFDGDPQPRILYGRMNDVTLVIHNEDRLLAELAGIREMPYVPPTDQVKLAYELLHLHLSDPAGEAGYLGLVTALEALTQAAPKQPEVVQAIENLEKSIEDWKAQGHITKATAETLGNILREGKKKSIRQTMFSLVSKIDGTYDGQTPKKFVDAVYSVRSSLVHGEAGDKRPTQADRKSDELRRLLLDVLRSTNTES